MKRMWRWRWRHSACAVGMVLSFSALATPGSWVGEVGGVRLFTPGRTVESALIRPPTSLPSDARIRTLRWRFERPVGQPRPEAWLCHARRCIELVTARGRSQALAGLAAGEPLHFRFRLPARAHAANPFRIEALQVIVDYH